MFKEIAIILLFLFSPNFSYGSIEEFRLKYGGEEYAKSVKEQEERRKMLVAQEQQLGGQVFAYSDSTDHYSFDLPDGWKEIPKSAIDKVTDEIAKQADTKRIEYVSGFQLEGKEYFEYPYILVQKHKLDTPSFSQLEKTLSGSNFQEKVNRETSAYSELLKNSTTEKPFIDKERNIIFMNIQMDVANIGQIKGLMAMFLGKDGITQLNFYSTTDEYSKWLPIFNSAIDSFKYDDGFAYNPTEAKKNDKPSLFKGALDEGITGAITGGSLMLIIGLIRILFGRKNKKDMELKKYCKECGNEISASATTCNKCGKEMIKK